MVQFIRSPSGDELAVLPRSDYEDLVDARSAREARAALDEGREELLNLDEVKALAAASSPLAFWRLKRGMAQDELAQRIGTTADELSELEAGRGAATPELYRRLAGVLGVTFDEIRPRTRSAARRGAPASAAEE